LPEEGGIKWFRDKKLLFAKRRGKMKENDGGRAKTYAMGEVPRGNRRIVHRERDEMVGG